MQVKHTTYNTKAAGRTAQLTRALALQDGAPSVICISSSLPMAARKQYSARLKLGPRLRFDNGSSDMVNDLAAWMDDRQMKHGRGEALLRRHQAIKRMPWEQRRLHHAKIAA